MAQQYFNDSDLRYNLADTQMEYQAGDQVWLPAAPSSNVPETPSIVVRVALVAQSADIPQTVLFTVPSTGLYQVSYYAVTTSIDAGAGTALQGSIYYTSDAGAQTNVNILLPIDLTYLLGYNNLVTVPYNLVGGTTFSYDFLGGGTYGTAQYSFYLTVTKL